MHCVYILTCVVDDSQPAVYAPPVRAGHALAAELAEDVEHLGLFDLHRGLLVLAPGGGVGAVVLGGRLRVLLVADEAQLGGVGRPAPEGGRLVPGGVGAGGLLQVHGQGEGGGVTGRKGVGEAAAGQVERRRLGRA